MRSVFFCLLAVIACVWASGCDVAPAPSRTSSDPSVDVEAISAGYARRIDGNIDSPTEARFLAGGRYVVVLDRLSPRLRLFTREGRLLWTGIEERRSAGPESVATHGDEVLVLRRGSAESWLLQGDTLALVHTVALPEEYLPLGAVRTCGPGWIVYVRHNTASQYPVGMEPSYDPEIIPFAEDPAITELWSYQRSAGSVDAERHAGVLFASAGDGVVILHRPHPMAGGRILELDCSGRIRRTHAERSLVTGDSLPVLLPRPRPLEWPAGVIGLPDGFAAAQHRWFAPAIHAVEQYHYQTEVLRFARGEYVGSALIPGQWLSVDYQPGVGILLASSEPVAQFMVLPETVLVVDNLRSADP